MRNKIFLLLVAVMICFSAVLFTVVYSRKIKTNVAVEITFGQTASGVEFFIEYPAGVEFNTIRIVNVVESMPFISYKVIDGGCWVSILAINEEFENNMVSGKLEFNNSVKKEDIKISQIVAYQNVVSEAGENKVEKTNAEIELK